MQDLYAMYSQTGGDDVREKLIDDVREPEVERGKFYIEGTDREDI